MSGVLSDVGKRRALAAMLGPTIPGELPVWTAEVELRAEWVTPGNRWRGLFRSGLAGFFHPSPVPHSLTWRTERHSIRLRQTGDGFENEDALHWDLLSMPPAPSRSVGWEPRAVNVYDGDALIFAVPIPRHFAPPRIAHPEDAAEFASGAITLSIGG